MATIYLDTGFPDYKDGWFRVFNWDKALSVVKESDSLMISARYESVWPLVLDYLGQYALNMRQVSTYFRDERLRPYYERSPLEPKADQFWMNPFHQLMNSRMVETPVSFTNVSVSTSPQDNKLKESCICLKEIELIARKMPKLHSLSTLYIYMPSDYDRLESEALPILPITKILSHLSPIRWALFLNPDHFPVLRELKFEAAVMSSGLDRLPLKLMYSLRCLELHGFTSQEEGHYSGIKISDIFKVLRQVPLLEKLYLSGVLSLEEGTVELEPESVQALKVLHIEDSRINPIDLRILFAAAPFIQDLTLIGCDLALEAIETLGEMDLSQLRVAKIWLNALTRKHVECFLKAVPNLEKLNVQYKQMDEEGEDMQMRLNLYPSVKELFVKGMTLKSDSPRDSFLDLIEQMIELKSLTLRGLAIGKADMKEDAFTKLTSLCVMNACIDNAYLTNLLNRAKGLTSLVWKNSTSEWMFQNLEAGALSQLTHLSIDAVDTTTRELTLLFEKMPNLRDLNLGAVGVQLAEGEDAFVLSKHLLPNLTNLCVRESITPELCLAFLRVASQLETLSMPRKYFSLFENAPDGYFPKLKIIKQLLHLTERELDEVMPMVRRVAPNLEMKALGSLI